MKDSDITWLYGPVWSNYVETSPELQDNLNITPSSSKSCLKKKSMSENFLSMTIEKCDSILSPVENHHRKIQFNNHVEQYIAVDNEDSSDDGEVDITSSKEIRKSRSTICKLAPTKLKEDRIHIDEYFSLYSNSTLWYYKIFF